MLKMCSINPIPLTEWVANLIPIDKKHGMICVCTTFRDLNKGYPKDNFPTPFIDYINDECAGNEIFSFMDGFSGYNQIQNHPKDYHKTTFIFPRVPLHTTKNLLASRMLVLPSSGPYHTLSMTLII